MNCSDLCNVEYTYWFRGFEIYIIKIHSNFGIIWNWAVDDGEPINFNEYYTSEQKVRDLAENYVNNREN